MDSVGRQSNQFAESARKFSISADRAAASNQDLRFEVSSLKVFYGSKEVLHGIDISTRSNIVTALIGPSGCGKSTFLRSLNRMTETIRQARVQGDILLDNENIRHIDVVKLRRRVGMVFQRPNPFPKSIFDNVAYGLRINGYRGKLSESVERSLRRAALGMK